MPLIGRLLKTTTALSYRKNAQKTLGYKHQVDVLKYLLGKAKSTKFGLFHEFQVTLKSTGLVEDFQKRVPIMSYDDYYEAWLKYSILGEKDNTWRGRIKYYALSSGTTGSPSKRIPITLEMIRSFQKTSIRQLSILHGLDLPQSFYNTSLLAVGGSTKLNYKETHVEGDLSGILKKHTSFIISPFTKPGLRISSMTDWNKKLDIMVEKAPKWDIGIIAGIPSWCLMLMEKIVDYYRVETIHDIWPNLQVYVHGGVFMEPYMNRLEKITSHKLNLLDTYLASEGYFGYQNETSRKGMKLLMNNGIFFEFVPFTSEYFDESGIIKPNAEAYTIGQVKEDVDYAIVISTNAGLWRYLIGDLVRFTDVEEHEVIITGRIRQFLSLCGEHLSLENINQGLIQTGKKFNVQFSEFTIYANIEKQCHSWFLGTSEEVPDSEEVMHYLDQQLCELNDDYKSARKYSLGDPMIELLKPEKFYEYMESIGKIGSQNKMPRVLNSKQAKQWLNFINGA
jgi:phenylacetate-coenzyme A ligase PaaK-like adenylate-forming protein